MSAVHDAALVCGFAHWFGVPRGCATVLAVLYLREEPVSADELARAARAAPSTVSCHAIKLLRQALEAEAIDHVPARGYVLTDVGRAECSAALTELAAEMLAAS